MLVFVRFFRTEGFLFDCRMFFEIRRSGLFLGFFLLINTVFIESGRIVKVLAFLIIY